MSNFTTDEKLGKLAEVFIMLHGHHQHNQAQIVQRIHEALSSGHQLPTQDVEDLLTMTRYGLLQARTALREIQESIAQATEIEEVILDILTDAKVQDAQREIDAVVQLGSTQQN